MEPYNKTRILIPISQKVDKERVTAALSILYFFRKPLIVLLHIIELPMTAPLDLSLYPKEEAEARKKLKSVEKWLREQGFEVRTKISAARDATLGIVDEADTGRYNLVILMKRRPPEGLKRLFYKSHTDRVTSKISCLSLILPVER